MFYFKLLDVVHLFWQSHPDVLCSDGLRYSFFLSINVQLFYKCLLQSGFTVLTRVRCRPQHVPGPDRRSGSDRKLVCMSTPKGAAE